MKNENEIVSSSRRISTAKHPGCRKKIYMSALSVIEPATMACDVRALPSKLSLL